VRFVPVGTKAPVALYLARAATFPIRVLTWPFRIGQPKDTRVASALTSLGPSYIKLGQFLATRPDVIGPELARDLQHLQDKLPPFSMKEARQAVEEALGGSLENHFAAFGPPVAAASIAQVHKAAVAETGVRRDVAVKVLRPGIERRFRRDLDSYFFAARQIERFHAPSRRLRPVAVVETLAQSVAIEMDMRLEAAAISEMADNIARDAALPDGAFRVPAVDWRRTARRVLTLEWIDGIPISDHTALRAAGHDLQRLGLTILRSFLRHAMRDGFFHADMHPGNLFVDSQGRVVAVDFGIMGRLGFKERRFLAEILHGLITRDYHRTAAVHFEAGYVPPHQSVEVFAQAMRAIGEPIHGRTADEISIADLLGQLFAYTEVFDMATRPELLLLQKTMVVVEGVARSLDPKLDMWQVADPVVREWIERNLGPVGKLEGAVEGAGEIGRFAAQVPSLLGRAATLLDQLDDITRDGLVLSPETVEAIGRAEQRRNRWTAVALWVIAALLAAVAWKLI
jgi:ubiquinone biosynthesis protein